MYADPRKLRLKNRAFAVAQEKGGSGKSMLLALLAALSARYGWRTVVVDIDPTRSLTNASTGGRLKGGTVVDALKRMAQGEQVDDLLVYAPGLQVYLLQAGIQGIPNELVRWIPQLIQNLKQAYVNTEIGNKPVDCVMVDSPGQDQEIIAAILAGVDYVAMPAMISAVDLAVMSLTLQLITSTQKLRDGKPHFLGIIPNRVTRKGYIERTFLDALLKSGKLLPYIPASDTLRSTFVKTAKDGGETAVAFAPNSPLVKRLHLLWDALNDPEDNSAEYAEDFRQFIGAAPAIEKAELAEGESHA